MSQNGLEEQVLALAGVFQCCQLVDQIARDGQTEPAALETAVNSLLVTSPSCTEDVFGSRRNVRAGLELLATVLSGEQSNRHMAALRYAMAVLHLEAKLRNTPDMLDKIAQRLEHAKSQSAHFGPLHENVFEGLASIYMDTISTFKLRIQVSGTPSHLQNKLNAAKIRTLLFASIRSAVLWRQLGGRRWHLIFRKKTLAKTARRLAASVDL